MLERLIQWMGKPNIWAAFLPRDKRAYSFACSTAGCSRPAEYLVTFVIQDSPQGFRDAKKCSRCAVDTAAIAHSMPRTPYYFRSRYMGPKWD